MITSLVHYLGFLRNFFKLKNLSSDSKNLIKILNNYDYVIVIIK